MTIDQMDGDIQVFGGVVYTGEDRHMQTLSGLFAGSNLARILINKHKSRVQNIINVISNKLR